jgi:hypothetical protein
MRNFNSTYKRQASTEEVKTYTQKHNESLRSYIQRWSIIKNSIVDVSDKRVIDAFTVGLRQGDLVKEMGRIKPKIVAELLDIANRFVDAYHNKRMRSPEDDKGTCTTTRGKDPATMITTVPTVK